MKTVLVGVDSVFAGTSEADLVVAALASCLVLVPTDEPFSWTVDVYSLVCGSHRSVGVHSHNVDVERMFTDLIWVMFPEFGQKLRVPCACGVVLVVPSGPAHFLTAEFLRTHEPDSKILTHSRRLSGVFTDEACGHIGF